MNLIRVAKEYRDKYGFSVFPVIVSYSSKDKKYLKKPAISSWKPFEERLPTDVEIDTGFGNKKVNAIGLVTGKISGVTVLDWDSKKTCPYDSTVRVKTISGGRHIYFKYKEGVRNTVKVGGTDLDVRGEGGFVVVPPSESNGSKYEWDTVGELAKELKKLPEFPELDEHKITQEKFAPPLDVKAFLNIPIGSRDDKLYRFACSLLQKHPEDEAWTLLLATANTYEGYGDSFTEKDVKAKYKSAFAFIKKEGKLFGRKLQNTKKKFKQTDTGNAELIADLYGNKIRYDHKRKRWLIWGEHQWKLDIDQAVNRYAIEAARKRYKDALYEKDSDKRTKIAKWAISSENRSKLDSATSILKSIFPVTDSGDGWDEDTMLLSCPNGILNLRNGVLRNGKPEDRITMATKVSYDSNATCPRWVQFIEEVFEGNEELIHYVQKAVGYSITGLMSEQVVFFGFGTGSNGKSVFFKTISSILGDYAYDAPASLFQRTYGGSSNTNDLASIEFKRFLVSSETLSTSKLNEQRIKGLTGGDNATARYLYSEFFTFSPTCKPWLFINHKPMVDDDSYGFWRRVRLIPFDRTFSQGEQDKNLTQELEKEYSGILNWMLEGCVMWQKEGLNPTPEIVKLATQEYREENDELSEFVADKCIENGNAKASELFKIYQEWAEKEQGLKGKDIMSRVMFGKRISDKYSKKHYKNGWFYKGISLVGDGFSHISEPSDELSIDFDETHITQPTLDSLEENRSEPSPEAIVYEESSPDFKCNTCGGGDYWIRWDKERVCSKCHPNTK